MLNSCERVSSSFLLRSCKCRDWQQYHYLENARLKGSIDSRAPKSAIQPECRQRHREHGRRFVPASLVRSCSRVARHAPLIAAVCTGITTTASCCTRSSATTARLATPSALFRPPTSWLRRHRSTRTCRSLTLPRSHLHCSCKRSARTKTCSTLRKC
jgi:hypothetical protein